MSAGPGARVVAGRGAAPALALGAALLAGLALLLPYRGYVTDETFLPLRFATHLAGGAGFSFNAGEPTYGVPSPLWVGLLALAGALHPSGLAVPGDAAATPWLLGASRALGAGFTLLAILLTARLARRLGWDSWTSTALAALLALNAWSARWALSGLESPLALAWTAAAWLLLARVLLEGRGAFAAGLCLGAGVLVRPEALLLAALAIAALARGAAGPSRARGALVAAAGWALVAVPWAVAAFAMFHRVLPNLVAGGPGAWRGPVPVFLALRTCLHTLLATDALPITLFVLVLAVGSPATALPPLSGRRAFWILVALWPAALVPGLIASGLPIGSGNLLLAAPSFLLLGVASLRWLMARNAPRLAGAALLAMVTLYAAQNLYVTLRVAAPSAARHAEGCRASLVAIGLWARATTPSDAVLASPEVGAIGYYSGRRILDLSGGVTPALAPLARKQGYDVLVRDLGFEEAGRADYLVDDAPEENRLARPGGEPGPYRFLFARAIPNLGITHPAGTVYSVYSIDWRAYDATRVRTALGPPDAVRVEPATPEDYNVATGRFPVGREGSNDQNPSRL